MPRSQRVLPSFTLALGGSVTLRDFQHACNREIHIPIHALPDDENLLVRRVRDIHLPATDFPVLSTAHAPAFIVYKADYYPDPEAASLFGDAQEEQISEGFFWRRLKAVLLKIKGFGGLFTI
ncbi:uncharacterized protein LACBIDRAFT_324607 [Laccaria bicolor S238N-H82]|uniref:Predicted protein n=1 Tax=Laccaria bicolor (strain S238N-H82 / ATCC MYA-4686) TaxID=486041 RepID=B0D2G1_LACBS|nr:uncharacterized protein LACBIDRAFT_324607 [Laccaria bicolor S238N-H82]EDR11094.1 predicted protein [Laccaria bicolor S238N-H82]|eukprot:XP_001878395.1 predicted protein [Laccaria bicolor S238N-H82]